MNKPAFVVDGWNVETVADTEAALQYGKQLAGELSEYIASTGNIQTLPGIFESMPGTDDPTAKAFLFELMKSEDKEISFYASYGARWLDEQQQAA